MTRRAPRASFNGHYCTAIITPPCPYNICKDLFSDEDLIKVDFCISTCLMPDLVGRKTNNTSKILQVYMKLCARNH